MNTISNNWARWTLSPIVPKPTTIGYHNAETLTPLWATDWKLRHLMENYRDAYNGQEFSYLIYRRYATKFNPDRAGDKVRPAVEHLAILCGALANPHIVSGSSAVRPHDVYSYPEDAKFIAHFLDAPEFILLDLATHPQMIVRNAVANRIKLSDELINVLSNDENEIVRATLLSNPNISEEKRVMLGLTVGRTFDFVPNTGYQELAQNVKEWKQLVLAAETVWSPVTDKLYS